MIRALILAISLGAGSYAAGWLMGRHSVDVPGCHPVRLFSPAGDAERHPIQIDAPPGVALVREGSQIHPWHPAVTTIVCTGGKPAYAPLHFPLDRDPCL